MRLAAYAGASTALAAAVVIHAFNQRANFYSACVYLSQSNLCLMILTNLILFITASLMFGLQRIFYGPLRPIEIEQLYEKAWFAVTETCLAMTIFRDEVGAWFLVMFVALLAGKVWGWIGEGRVEVLEQQPPVNPRLVHIRLSLSLAISLIYDMWLMSYTINTVIQQAKPNMMVMFLFEFAILTTTSWSTAFRYALSLVEARVVKKQTQERLEWRRREVREEREEILRQRSAAAAANEGAEADGSTTDLPALPSEDDVDEMDIEVPGWEAKGQWVLSLDLVTDFVKLGIYTTFFFILLTFYGLPIHIMRDLFLTARSFIKRLTAFLRYRKATHDMNERYPDASVEEIQREDTCIICREEMRPWSVTNPADPPVVPADGAVQPPVARPRVTPMVNERSRPKKLPCGHVLHLGCLKSWLERQQVCPTCRRPVVVNARPPQGQAQQPGQGAQAAVAGRGAPADAGAQPQPPVGQPNGNVRMINFGPFRFAFGQGNLQDFAQQRFPPAQPGQQNAPAGRMYGLELGFPRLQPQPPGAASTANGAASSIQAQLVDLEQQITQELLQLRLNQQELQIVTQLQAQLARLRSLRQNNPTGQPVGAVPHMPQMAPTVNALPLPAFSSPAVRMQQHGAVPGTSAIPSGSSDLPPGVAIPEGWTLLPLQRLDPALMGPPYDRMLSQIAVGQTTISGGAHAPAPGIPATGSAFPVVPRSASNVTQEAPVTPTAPTATSDEQPGPSSRAVPWGQLAGNPEPLDRPETPEPLPNWGASQMFGSSSSSRPQTASAHTDTDVTSSKSNPTGTEAVPSVLVPTEPVNPSTSNANGSVADHGRENENGEAPEHMGKGKARAAFVEDSNDEC